MRRTQQIKSHGSYALLGRREKRPNVVAKRFSVHYARPLEGRQGLLYISGQDQAARPWLGLSNIMISMLGPCRPALALYP